MRDAIVILSELDYQGVALTLDVHHLDPYSPRHEVECQEIRRLLADRGMACVIETGARFLLNPRRKHYPSLLCNQAAAAKRLDFYYRAIDTAAAIGATTIALWSGHDFDGVGADEGMDRLVRGLEMVLRRAEEVGVDVAFEPEPGMFVESLPQYDVLRARIDSERFGLALDLGHILVTQECEPAEAVRRYRADLLTVTIEDMKRGIHRHLPFGEGDMEVGPILLALEEIGYRGLLIVELSRESAEAPTQAARAMHYLANVGKNLGWADS